jgi:hypothetical protein
MATLAAAVRFDLKSTVPVSRARHLDSTVRALEAARDLIVALRLCEKSLAGAREEVDEEAYALVSRMSQHLYCVGELARLLQAQVNRCAEERAEFWKPR